MTILIQSIMYTIAFFGAVGIAAYFFNKIPYSSQDKVMVMGLGFCGLIIIGLTWLMIYVILGGS